MKDKKNEVKAEAKTEAVAGAERKVEELTAAVAELTGDLQRTRADFENYRKQVDLQKEAAKKATKSATLVRFLPLLDDLDRAFLAYAELAPLQKSFTKTLAELGLARVATDGEFDPDLHDAVMVEGDGEKEVIAEVLRPGYYYEGEVLRPAMVKVRKM